jgi:predicted GNAT family N-acyltransferase
MFGGSKACMGQGVEVAVDPRQDGSAFVCVCGRSTAANCETAALGNRSLRVAKEADFGLVRRRNVVQDGCANPSQQRVFPMPEPTSNAPAMDGVVLRPMTAADLPRAHALSAELRWPHRPADWEQMFAHADGIAVERDGEIIATGLRWRWGESHATIGLVIVTPACQGRRIGHRLMSALLEGLEDRTVLLHATAEGRGLYERLGFVRTGEMRQHQGIAQPAPLVALHPGWRLRPAGLNELPALQALDAAARGMPRDALVAELLQSADACVVLDHDNAPKGFAMLRRFGRGHSIGPVVAPDAEGAKALIAHLVGLNAGNFTRIDIDFDSGLAEWIESIGLLRVDAPTTMVRGEPLAVPVQGPSLFAIVTQAVG